MTRVDGAFLWQCLTEPQTMAGTTGSTATDLLNLAWRQGVIFRLAREAQSAGVLGEMPAQAAGALSDLAIEADYNARNIGWEINRVAAALRGAIYPVLLLKGGAYEGAEFAFARGRYSSDLDILVPKANIEECEAALKEAGWVSEAKSTYDEHYYRDWMHEVPPLRHHDRQTIIDLHHNILPPVARIAPNIEAFIADAVEVSEWPLKRPSLADLFVHSALHSFYDGDFAGNIRNMLDLRDLLLLGLEANEQFIAQLIERSKLHSAQVPVADALGLLAKLGTLSLASSEGAFVKSQARSGPVQAIFDWCLRQRTQNVGPFRRGDSAIAKQMLYIRSHWITMPPGMLAKHLVRKARMRFKGEA